MKIIFFFLYFQSNVLTMLHSIFVNKNFVDKIIHKTEIGVEVSTTV